MGEYVIFGAGDFGTRIIDCIGKEAIDFYIDNNIDKQRSKFHGFDVYSLDKAMKIMTGQIIIVAVSEKYKKEIEELLKKKSIKNYVTFRQVQIEKTKEKLQRRFDYIGVHHKAIKWIIKNSIPNEGIINNTKLQLPYPEVTGYYIPTLIRWGYRDLAVSYAKWLCSIQKEDGSWYDTNDKEPYVFDSAQILKGLLAVRAIYPSVDEHIIRGCEWILGNMTDEGRLVAPNQAIWDDGKTYSELIHTYCISPIYEAGKVFNRLDFMEKADKMVSYYTTTCREQILNFDLLSHFYAYIMEAMLDIGKVDLAKEAMEKLSHLQKKSGAVPAYKNVDWVCATGLFQLAIVWLRLGDFERGNKAFEYACKLQNESGGWYGSYLSEENSNEKNNYFPESEISWAVKYFLDALYYKNVAQFEYQADMFLYEIRSDDGRYQIIKNIIDEERQKKEKLSVLDVGCGKGRYLRKLVEDELKNEYYAVDLSLRVMEYFSDIEIKEKKQGNLTNIPYPDNFFDVVYTCEALCHAVDIERAISELARVTKPGGRLVIIDKNKNMLGFFDIEKWEQWFDEDYLKDELNKYCSNVKVNKEINFDAEPANGLFYAWIGIKKE